MVVKSLKVEGSETYGVKTMKIFGAMCVLSLIYSYVEPGYRSRYSDSLRVGRSGNQIPVGARFSAPIQTGCEAHPASCTMETGSFPGVKAAGAWC
jgi:hypothetical protein